MNDLSVPYLKMIKMFIFALNLRTYINDLDLVRSICLYSQKLVFYDIGNYELRNSYY